MINPRLVALNGLGGSPLSVATLGYMAPIEVATSGGMAGRYRQHDLFPKHKQPHNNFTDLHAQDTEAVDLIISLVTKGFFHGHV